MKERLKELAKGNVEREIPQIVFSCEKLEASVAAGNELRAEISIKSKNKIPFKGVLYSSDDRVQTSVPKISNLNAYVGIEVNASMEKPGTVIKGAIQFVSNAGEYELPFSFSVTEPAEGAAEFLQTMEDFIHLYQVQPEAALRIYSSDQFLQLPFMKDPWQIACYEASIVGNREVLGLEAFFIAVGKKKAVHFTLEKSTLVMETEEKYSEQSLEVLLDTWGYIELALSSDADWIQLKKKRLSETDFKESHAEVPFTIDYKKLHAGVNFGRITVRSADSCQNFEVTIRRPAQKHAVGQIDKKNISNLLQMYLLYKHHRYEDEVILASLDNSLAAAIKRYPGTLDLYLMRAWALIEMKRDKEAGMLIEWCRNSITDTRSEMAEKYCIFLYLDARLRHTPEVINNSSRIIHKYYEKKPTPLITLIDLYSTGTPEAEAVYGYLRKFYEEGNRSPVLYMMASLLVEKKQRLFSYLGMFELEWCCYLAKNEFMTEDLKKRFLSFPVLHNRHSRLYLRILYLLYRTKPDRDVVEAVCSVMVRQGRVGAQAFVWYQRGIKEDFQMNSLSDYYLASIPEPWKVTIPKEIMMYYSYTNHLDDQTRMKLYSYIIENYDHRSDLYCAYQDQMKQFAFRELLNGHMNPKLVPVYKDVLCPEMIDERIGKILPDLLYSKHIVTKLSGMKNVIIRYPQLCMETVRPMELGEGCVPIYTKTAAILFEDAYGNRYADPDAEVSTLMELPELIEICRKNYPNQVMLFLEETYPLYQNAITSGEMLERVLSLLSSEELNRSFKHLLVSRIVEYCYFQRNADTKNCDEVLLHVKLTELDPQVRAYVPEIYIRKGYLAEAFEIVKTYGCGQIAPDLLLKMTTRMIQERLYEYHKLLLSLCEKLIEKSQWNETVLNYMASNYNGTTDSMFRLLTLINEQKEDPKDLPERVVAQMLFTGNIERLDQAYDYYEKSTIPSEEIQRAFLVLKCHDYFLAKNVLKESYEKQVEELVQADEKRKLPPVLYYSLLIYYSREENLTIPQKKFCSQVLSELCEKGCYLQCFLLLQDQMDLPHQIEGKMILEWRGDQYTEVFAKALLADGSRQVIPFHQIYPGVFTGYLTGFPDDKPVVSIYGIEDGKAELIEERKTDMEQCYKRQQSRYSDLCEALKEKQRGQLDNLQALCIKMERKTQMEELLFLPVEV